MPSNVLPLHLKQTFPPIIWIFTEGDGIKSRLPFKIFSTLPIAHASLGLAIVKNVEEFIDNTIGEDCEFECRPGYEAIPNLNHQSTTNGCGSLDLIFDDSEESFIHVEQEFTQVGIQKLRHLHLKYASHVELYTYIESRYQKIEFISCFHKFVLRNFLSLSS